MKKILLAITVLTAGFLFSCTSGNDPKTVLIDFADALTKKDLVTARKLATADSKELFDMMDEALKTEDDKTKVNSTFDKANMEFGEAKIEGNIAKVPVKDKKTGKTTNFTLKKEDNKWKVVFTIAAIIEMDSSI
ncbi:MAG: DUF4878 domain-containing protein [Chitinophagaceae bacterium]|nr:DUF4878 domain-containing protein [Chitinophagaceae bacterium]